MISDKRIEDLSKLSKLVLSEEEKRQVKQDMEKILDYIDKLNELDTEGVEPLSHILSLHNVFREDIVTNGDERESILRNAPRKREGMIQVPKTVE